MFAFQKVKIYYQIYEINFMKKILGISALAFALPQIAFAQTVITDIIDTIYEILNAIVPVLIVLATIFFFWGLAKFILNAGDSEGRKQGVQIMIYGVIGLFVIVSVWGLVALLQNTLKTTDKATTVQGPGNTKSLVPPKQ